MSTFRIAILRALPFTFAIYVVQALVATYATLPFTLEIARVSMVGTWDASARAAWLERILELAPVFRAFRLQLALSALLLFALAPWLHMSWLASLDRLRSPASALACGGRRVLQAWLVSAYVAAMALLLLAFPCALAYCLHAWIDASNARLHDLALLGVLVATLPIGLYLYTLHDLARARALEDRAFLSVRKSLLEALRPSVQWRACLWLALGHAIVVGAHLASAYLPVELRALVPVMFLQSALFARLVTRSAWLAFALACTGTPHEAVVRRSE